MLVAGFSVAGGASFVPSVSASNDDRTLTNYERQNQGQRLAPWERAENNAARESVTGTAIESSNLPVDAEALQESYDRIRQSSGWVAIEDQVDDQTDRIGDLEDLLDQMELASSWQEQPPVVGAWESGTSGASAMWEPPIDRQLSDFTQTRTVVTTLSRPVTVYEVRASTGERREIDSYIETKTIEDEQSREIDVTVSAWSDSGSPFDCKSWSPSADTVTKGDSFTQSGSGCNQDQSRQISYAVADSGALAGTPWTQHQTLGNVLTTRMAVGTKASRECRYNYDPVITYFAELDNPDSPSFLWRETKSESGEGSYAAIVLVDYWINPSNPGTGGGENLYPVHNGTQKEFLDGTWSPSSENYVIHNGKKYTRGDFIGTSTVTAMYITFTRFDYELCWEPL